jgi:hypothetical protein
MWSARHPTNPLTRMFEDLKRRHIALGVEALMLSGDGQCGVGVEGYSAPRQMLAIANRIKTLGGTLSYVVMDGPLMGGHFYSGPRACHSSVEAIAKEVAEKVKQMRTVFPDLKVGDVEPVGVLEPAGWMNSSSSGPRLTRRPPASHSLSCVATCNGADHGRRNFVDWRRGCVRTGPESA